MKNFDRENIDELLEIRQIRQYFPHQNFAPYGIQNLHILTLQQFCLPNSLPPCLPAIRPSSTMARAKVFYTIKVFALDLQICCFEEILSTAP